MRGIILSQTIVTFREDTSTGHYSVYTYGQEKIWEEIKSVNWLNIAGGYEEFLRVGIRFEHPSIEQSMQIVAREIATNYS